MEGTDGGTTLKWGELELIATVTPKDQPLQYRYTKLPH